MNETRLTSRAALRGLRASSMVRGTQTGLGRLGANAYRRFSHRPWRRQRPSCIAGMVRRADLGLLLGLTTAKVPFCPSRTRPDNRPAVARPKGAYMLAGRLLGEDFFRASVGDRGLVGRTDIVQEGVEVAAVVGGSDAENVVNEGTAVN